MKKKLNGQKITVICNLCKNRVEKPILIPVSDNIGEGHFFLHPKCYDKQRAVWFDIFYQALLNKTN